MSGSTGPVRAYQAVPKTTGGSVVGGSQSLGIQELVDPVKAAKLRLWSTGWSIKFFRNCHCEDGHNIVRDQSHHYLEFLQDWHLQKPFSCGTCQTLASIATDLVAAKGDSGPVEQPRPTILGITALEKWCAENRKDRRAEGHP